jgi:hypothetical protein
MSGQIGSPAVSQKSKNQLGNSLKATKSAIIWLDKGKGGGANWTFD